ncbi:NTP transferase domain-containing protein [Streptomyces sp. NBC_00249]|uniref:nucleotidyltransferase family protein n=1 Tax=Streptomyces sp. NBC_00249 TaxID=2975690 RepID=UPI0022540D8B|nr:NTP transferase domain-containing protein [Streptomyces sp. NBC_00249]MCX5195916.1 NTP transferase domain-containing protein [Streptomyces sp. NBC_00249]
MSGSQRGSQDGSQRGGMYDCVIMCGGLGNRLKPLTHDTVPKPLVRVGGRELITYAIDLLGPAFIRQVIFAVDHHADQLQAWLESAALSYETRLSFQEQPGYLNAVECAMRESGAETVLFCHADEIKPGLRLDRALAHHSASGLPATVVTTYADRLYRHWVVSGDESSQRVTDIAICPDDYRRTPDQNGLVLAGALILDKAAFPRFDPELSLDYLGIVRPLIDAGELGYFVSPTEALFNISTQEEYEDAIAYVSGEPAGGRTRLMEG